MNFFQIISKVDKPNIRIRRIADQTGETFLKKKIPDEKGRSALINGLRLFTLDPGTAPPSSPVFPSNLKEIAEKETDSDCEERSNTLSSGKRKKSSINNIMLVMRETVG